MKILCISDWHIRATNPQYRTDDYFSTLMGKLNWVFDLAEKEGCKAILQAGDMFDGPDQSNRVELDMMKLFKNSCCDIFTIFGQHDCRYRDKSLTVTEKFRVNELVDIAIADPFILGEEVRIYGASFGEEVPKVKDPDAKNILIIHRMITEDGPQWHDQTDFISAKAMLLKYGDYDLILSGDNHKSFSYGKQFGSILLNCGSLMRTTIAQRDHKPCFYVVDTATNKVEKHFIPVKPIEEVMDLETADEQKERNAALEEFMSGLSIEYRSDLSFEENLQNVITVNKTDDVISNIIQSFLIKWHDKIGGK